MISEIQPQMNTDEPAAEEKGTSAVAVVANYETPGGQTVSKQSLPLVSIGVPAYNAGKTIKAMIESVLNQSYENWELLLCDDGSTDDTVRIAESFKDSRIRIFSDGRNLKIARRLNQLVENAAGIYFARMDADDQMFPDRLERQVRYLAENEDVDVLGGGAVVVDENGSVLGGRNIVFTPRDTDSFIHPTVIGKTEWFRKNRYDERFSGYEDLELWRRARKGSVYRLLDGAVIYYRDSLKFDLRQYLFRQKQVMKAAVFGAKIDAASRMKIFCSASLRCFVAFSFWALGLSRYFVRRRNKKLVEVEI